MKFQILGALTLAGTAMGGYVLVDDGSASCEAAGYTTITDDDGCKAAIDGAKDQEFHCDENNAECGSKDPVTLGEVEAYWYDYYRDATAYVKGCNGYQYDDVFGTAVDAFVFMSGVDNTAYPSVSGLPFTGTCGGVNPTFPRAQTYCLCDDGISLGGFSADGFGDPHYVCPSGEKYDFEGVTDKSYSLIKDTSLNIVVTYTTGDAAQNTVAPVARRLLSSADAALEQNSVYTYMDSVTIDDAIVLAPNVGNLKHFSLLNLVTGAACTVGTDCDLTAFSGYTMSVADVGPCKFHRPGRKLLPKGEKALIRDRTTDASCQALTISTDAFSASFTFVPAGEMNGSAGVNYLDFSLNSVTTPTASIDGIIGQCYRSDFSARYEAFPSFLKTKFCDSCEREFAL